MLLTAVAIAATSGCDPADQTEPSKTGGTSALSDGGRSDGGRGRPQTPPIDAAGSPLTSARPTSPSPTLLHDVDATSPSPTLLHDVDATWPSPALLRASQTSSDSESPEKPKPFPAQWRLRSHGKVVAIGDIHGDYEKMLKALRLAGAIDDKGRWVGGNMTVVQTGDQLDRGDGDKKILDYLHLLRQVAGLHGGAVVILNGNHEYMNVGRQLQYTNVGANIAFAEEVLTLPIDWAKFHNGMPLNKAQLRQGISLDTQLLKDDANARGDDYRANNLVLEARQAVFLPGQKYSLILAERPPYAIVDDTVFVHGGLTAWHLENVNLDKAALVHQSWLDGDAAAVETIDGMFPGDPNGYEVSSPPYWYRGYGGYVSPETCADLHTVLNKLRVKRMVVGHTIQEHVNAQCNGELWRIDVRLSDTYAPEWLPHPVEFLQIDHGHPRAVTEAELAHTKQSAKH